jgi:hypothetical protein
VRGNRSIDHDGWLPVRPSKRTGVPQLTGRAPALEGDPELLRVLHESVEFLANRLCVLSEGIRQFGLTILFETGRECVERKSKIGACRRTTEEPENHCWCCTRQASTADSNHDGSRRCSKRYFLA